jgi:hypothetical protein
LSPEEIAAALAGIATRLDELERRLARIESTITRPQEAPAPTSAQETAPTPAARPAAGPNPYRFHLPRVRSAPADPGRMETTFGLVWISRIAVVTVVLALAFFFEYAFESHWISDWGRVALGIAAGGLALAFGELFWRRSHRVFAQALTAAGIGFVYLSVWAAYGPYNLLSRPVAFGLMVAATASAGLLALRYASMAVALLGLAGGFATPLLLGGAGAAWFVPAYALVLDLGAAACARTRGWRRLETFALAGTVVLVAVQWPPAPAMRWPYAFFLLAFYALFATSRAPEPGLLAQAFAPVALCALWAPQTAALWPVLGVSAAGLALAGRRKRPGLALAALAGFWLAYGTWSMSAPSPPPLGVLLPLTAAFLLFAGYPIWRSRSAGPPARFEELAFVALNPWCYYGAGYALLAFEGRRSWEGFFTVAVALAVMAGARLLWNRDSRAALLSAGIAWALLIVAAPVQFAGYRITIAWAAEGAALAWIGVRLRLERAVTGAFAVFALVFLRLALADSRLYAGSALLNARFLAFAASAAAVWAASRWIRTGRRAMAAYLTGHAFLLRGLYLEIVGWAARNAVPADRASVASLGISVLTAAYAVLMAGAGALRAHPPSRILGTVLIGLVVLKLYLYDVWLLAPFYRVIAFSALGALLLAMSYLYSRFRTSIEGWWRPETPPEPGIQEAAKWPKR